MHTYVCAKPVSNLYWASSDVQMLEVAAYLKLLQSEDKHFASISHSAIHCHYTVYAVEKVIALEYSLISCCLLLAPSGMGTGGIG